MPTTGAAVPEVALLAPTMTLFDELLSVLETPPLK
jgi:hypothetical protein